MPHAAIDAGTYRNTACVDDGPAGADPKCANADVPSSRTPSLSFDNTATAAIYTLSLHDALPIFTATNTGNTTLAAVTITDTLATLGTCTPANGSPLAPGATLVCAATHVVTRSEERRVGKENSARGADDHARDDPNCANADGPSSRNPALLFFKPTTAYDYTV